MKYNISKPASPKMPVLGKGTECIQILLKQVSKDMYEPLVPMIFPILGAHISKTEFQYPDLTWKEPCGMMAKRMAKIAVTRINCQIRLRVRRRLILMYHRPSNAS